MDFVTILIFVGFILAGIICGLPIGFICGRKSVWREVDRYEYEKEHILEAQIIH